MRPNIAYSASKLSKFTNSLGDNYWKVIVRVHRYLRYTKDYELHYTNYPSMMEGYCDANWISNNKNSKSTCWYVFTLCRAVVSWKFSKQTCIPRSTMKIEFIALDKAREETE